ncbi:MAG: FeoB-associated Cys-rich membrane protein [Muribaculaceae bacterium]|nr:FeoB-associated Cys-rich membrane protein [Muribaculaceae bacterium]
MSSNAIQWIIVGVVVLAAIVVVVRNLIRRKDPCSGCSLKDLCTKSTDERPTHCSK